MTATGHPRAIYRRAIERGSLVVAESMARELGTVDLAEALDAALPSSRAERALRGFL